MKHKIFIFIFSLVLTVSLGSFERVFACSDDKTDMDCVKAGSYSAIFTGKIQEIKKLSEPPKNISSAFVVGNRFMPMDYSEVIIEVKEAFAGVKKNSLTNVILMSSKFIRECGFELVENEEYLFYARKKLKDSPIVGCADVKNLAAETRNLEFFRNLKKNTDGSTISGSVYREGGINNYKTAHLNTPLSEIEITLKSYDEQNLLFKTKTDSEGKYEFLHVPAGRYIVRPTLPEEKILADGTIIGAHATGFGCEHLSFIIQNENQISGKVFDEKNEPVASVKVEIFSTAQLIENRSRSEIIKETVDTDENGDFYFIGVPAGTYYIAVNYAEPVSHMNPYLTTFYPFGKTKSSAAIINIGENEIVDDIVFRSLRKVERRKIYGEIVFPKGTPASSASLELYNVDTGEKSVCCGNSDEKGNFSFEAYEGDRYQIKAITSLPDSEDNFIQYKAESKVFLLDENTNRFKLILQEKKR